MRKWLLRIFTTMAVATAAVGVAAAPAHAAYSDCPADRVCMWIDSNATGSMYYWGPEFNWSCVNIGAPFHDAVTSIRNNLTASWLYVTVYQHSNCTGAVVPYANWHTWYQGPWYPNNQGNVAGYNDEASSFYMQPMYT